MEEAVQYFKELEDHDPLLHWLHKGAVVGVIARRVKATLLKSSNWTSSGRTVLKSSRSTHGRHPLPENREDEEGREEEKEQHHDGVINHQEAWMLTLD